MTSLRRFASTPYRFRHILSRRARAAPVVFKGVAHTLGSDARGDLIPVLLASDTAVSVGERCPRGAQWLQALPRSLRVKPRTGGA